MKNVESLGKLFHNSDLSFTDRILDIVGIKFLLYAAVTSVADSYMAWLAVRTGSRGEPVALECSYIPLLGAAVSMMLVFCSLLINRRRLPEMLAALCTLVALGLAYLIWSSPWAGRRYWMIPDLDCPGRGWSYWTRCTSGATFVLFLTVAALTIGLEPISKIPPHENEDASDL